MATSLTKLTHEIRRLTDPDYKDVDGTITGTVNASLFRGFPATPAAAAANWATAYDTYASDAVDPSGSAIAVKNKAGFQAALTFAQGAANGDDLATQFSNAFVAYWTAATFALGAPFSSSGNVGGNGIFASETTSIVTAIVPATLLAALKLEFAIKSMDGKKKAEDLAAVFHTGLSTITVVITGLDTTPTPGGPLAITKTGPPT